MRKSIALFWGLMPLMLAAAPDIIFENFEGGSYAPKWTVEGEAFADAPAKGTFSNQQKVSGYSGEFLINTYFKGDGTVGKITSVPVKIERPYLDALVGGGEDMQRLYLRVLVGGNEVGRITGSNDEALMACSINLSAHQGKIAVIEIVDNATGGWGHINVDNIVFTDTPKGISHNALFQIKKAKRYLEIPINNAAPKRRVKVSDAEGNIFLLNARLHVDFENPQWIMSLETREFEGRGLIVEMGSRMNENAELKTSDKYNAGDYPNEFLRPQYHFTAPQGWLNDPNGLVFWRGKWRMYYQLTPYELKSGVKYWGYAVSDDLLKWKHKPIAINAFYYQNGGDNAIWSGTAFADTKNQSGLFDKNGGLVFAYTFTGRGDFVASSPDGDNIKTFDSPITKAGGRDPCVFFHDASQKWIVLRYEIVKPDEWAENARKFVFYSSKDLKNWERGQVLDDFYECPFMIAMPVNGDMKNMKYLIFDARGECVVGDFDGEKFTPIGGRRAKFLEGNAYAGQVFNNVAKGRVVGISWLIHSGEDFIKRGMSFAQIMTIPYELKLVEKNGEYQIFASPVDELKSLYGKEKRLKNLKLSAAGYDTDEIKSSSMIEAHLDMSDAKEARMRIGNLNVRFVKKDNAYFISRHEDLKDGLSWQSGRFKMNGEADASLKFKIFIDRSSIEIFHKDEKLIALHAPFGDSNLQFSISGDGLIIKELTMREITPAFDKAALSGL